MHRIDTSGHVGNRFNDGNPQAGQEATVIDAAWLNAIQENLVDLITFAGIALVKGDDTQVRDAVVALIAGVVGTGGGSVPTTREVLGAGLATGGGPLAADLTITVPKASAAEVLAAVNDTKAVTPLSLSSAFARVLSPSGYITIPLGGGLIVQWLNSTVAGNGSTILNWPTSFPNGCYGALCNGGQAALNSQDNPPFASGWGTSNVSIFNDLGGSTGVFVVGIGN